MTVWLKLKEAAEYVKLHPDTVRAAVTSGDIPAYKVGTGREFRLTAEDMDEWMKSRSWEPRSA